jgi:ketol-acid reductoisomerase
MKTYYDEDASLEVLANKIIAVIGYGIQGRAQSLNLRDSGFNVIIGNISDEKYNVAKSDGFEVMSISEAVELADVIFLLIPDQAHKQVYQEHILPKLTDGCTMVFAHGYSIHYKEIVPKVAVNIVLLAPRMPGEPIRDYYKKGGGVPAFVDVYQDYTGDAWDIVLSLAKGIGATKAGVMHVSFKEETEIDLFIEQFFLPLIIQGIRLSFDYLVEKKFTPEAVLSELYASGEIGELMLMATKGGIYKVWKENASPTCQFGIFSNLEKAMPTEYGRNLIGNVLEGLRDGSFVNSLSEEARNDYANLHKYDKRNDESLIVKTQQSLDKIIKYK